MYTSVLVQYEQYSGVAESQFPDFSYDKSPMCMSSMKIPYVYISQLIRYARACYSYENFLKRGQLLTKKLMMQGYNESR